MNSTIKAVEAKFIKPKIADVRTGDTVKVSQRIKEGNKERTQIFEGLVLKASKLNSIQARILVRKIASGVGVEKSFMLHSPLVEKIEVVKRSKVRQSYLTYMRSRKGKSARLSGIDFDKAAANDVSVEESAIEESVKTEQPEAKQEEKLENEK